MPNSRVEYVFLQYGLGYMLQNTHDSREGGIY